MFSASRCDRIQVAQLVFADSPIRRFADSPIRRFADSPVSIHPNIHSMKRYVVSARALVSAVAVLALAACGPKDLVGKDKLDPIKEGMPKDSVLTIIGTGPLTPVNAPDVVRLQNGFRTQAYLVNGMNYRVLWYREAIGTLDDSISRQTDTPILFRNDTVMGWGWSYYDKKSEEIGLPNPLHDRERLDSISKSQQVNPPR
jgi:hypothetical protein